MTKSLLTITGFLLLLSFCHVEPEHEHVDARLYFNNLKQVHIEYCVTTDMIVIQGEHKKTSYHVRY